MRVALCLDWSSAESHATYSVARDDYYGAGDLNLAAGNGGQLNSLYRNDGGVVTVIADFDCHSLLEASGDVCD